MHKYKLGQKLWLNHSVEEMTKYPASAKLTYMFVIVDKEKDGYKVGSKDGYAIWEPQSYVEDESNYLTKQTMRHILYG